MVKRGRPARLDRVIVPTKCTTEIKLPQNKVDDVKSLFLFKPQVHQGFFNSIQSEKSRVADVEMLDDELCADND